MSECTKCRGQKDCCEVVEEIYISDEETARIERWVKEGIEQ